MPPTHTKMRILLGNKWIYTFFLAIRLARQQLRELFKLFKNTNKKIKFFWAFSHSALYNYNCSFHLIYDFNSRAIIAWRITTHSSAFLSFFWMLDATTKCWKKTSLWCEWNIKYINFLLLIPPRVIDCWKFFFFFYIFLTSVFCIACHKRAIKTLSEKYYMQSGISRRWQIEFNFFHSISVQ